MAVLKIETGVDNKILRTKSATIKRIDKKIKKLIADMKETTLAVDGLGLAAPQIGQDIRLFIARLNYGTPNELMVPMINAEILAFSEDMQEEEEGCLSLPKRFGIVNRHAALTVSYTDERNTLRTLKLEGLNARIIQHEIDHLNGILIADKMKEVDATGRKGRGI